MFRWLFPPEPKGITRLEYLQVMDKLSDQIDRCSIKIRSLKGKAEQSYWMRAWEDLVHLHMEMEYGLHPKNPDPAQFIGE